MTDPAGRPTGSGRATEGERRTEGERPPESAAFEPERLGGARRGRPPLIAAAFVVVLVAIVAVGLGGRLGVGAFPLGAENAAPAPTLPDGSAQAASASAASASAAAPTPDVMPAFPADTGPIYTSPPGPMQIQAKRHPQTIFVHGDIAANQITWVYVGVLDDVGRVAGWTSVSLPGAAGANKLGGPTLRFDTELAIPSDFTGRLWVRAQAYDSSGKVVASASVEIPAAGS